ncbi:hypothetical protein QBC47DRAFT_383596 [Echria macrotheca]|uniref:Heterokaryon incompatibility domain-containing protein n=1 Tax=Echria macrotheca TaxID=438768 RepID=A0AAJ0BCL8_9PEZI|nr:hypothetical protein QBC47DRAFT_383596 [Echria macrotheca]
MGAIYSSSVLTIIAAAGNSPEHGLPGVGGFARTAFPIPAATTIDPGPTIFWQDGSLRRDILESEWNQRGWTYQEALLSRRRLVFTDNEIYFQCHTMHAVESLQCLFLHRPGEYEVTCGQVCDQIFPSVRSNLGTSFWQRVNEYIRRRLSFEDDALNAFEGIIHAFKETDSSFQSIFGIPVSLCTEGVPDPLACLLNALTWTVKTEGWGYPRKRIYPLRRRRFPSWSWTDWKPAEDWPADRDLIKPSPWRCREIRPVVQVAFETLEGSIFPFQDEHAMVFALESENLLKPILRLAGWTFDMDIKFNSEKPRWGGTFLFEPRKVFSTTWLDYEVGLAKSLITAHEQLENEDLAIREIKCIALYTYHDRNWGHCCVLLVSRKPGTDSYERIGPLDLPFFNPGHNPEIWDEIGGFPGPDFCVANLAFEEIVLC